MIMEQYQKVSLSSLWNVQGPYDVNSIVRHVHEDERYVLVINVGPLKSNQ